MSNRVKNKMSNDLLPAKTGWDEAIADAKKRIRGLEFSIRVFAKNKKEGRPWGSRHTDSAATQQ